ncbi:Inosine-5'-monophosphate dehydrogenase [uncultured Candidatus Thioglobus sp.]|nr:Inosine-5'-monophosphate dehydrogenase [uncultured Candidatus Thioglobus sp.]
MAIALSQQGGLGVIHKNMTIERQAKEVRMVKRYKSGIVKDPLTVTPTTPIKKVLELTKSFKISGLPVVNGEELVGIVTSRDMRFETRLSDPVSTIMTKKDKLVTVPEGTAEVQIKELLHNHRIEKILVVNKDFQLRGLITVQDIQKTQAFPNACKDTDEQLRVGAAVGVGETSQRRVRALIAAGADIIVVDTAHGHSTGVIETVRWIKSTFPESQVVAGNIATAEAARALIEAGTDGVKVGIGPGSICTTRIITGVGVPQITAINNVAKELEGSKVKLIADGGVRFSGDIAKAIAAGADAVMVGSLLAGTEEAPGEVELYQGRSYKAYRGMGSIAAMAQQNGSADRYLQETDEITKLVPEGVEGRVPYKGSAETIITQLVGGIRAAMGYIGCKTIPKMHKNQQFIRLTNAGMRESHVHNIMITKEPPNYQVE